MLPKGDMIEKAGVKYEVQVDAGGNHAFAFPLRKSCRAACDRYRERLFALAEHKQRV